MSAAFRSPPPNSSSLLQNCLQAEASVLDPFYNTVKCIHCVLCLAIFALLAKLVAEFKRASAPLHPNLTMLLANALLLYALYAISYFSIHLRAFFIFFTYSHPCHCLTPPWLASLLRMPSFVYLITSPILHFAITIERVRATIFVRHYEREGTRCGVASLAIVWLISLLFNAYILLNAWADQQTFGQPLVYVTLTTKYNQEAIVNMHYAFLLIVICISAADYLIIRYNNKIHRNRVADYSLSRSYQTKENILIMRLIFPLDLSYSLFFLAFLLASVYLRLGRDQMGPARFYYFYEGINIITLLHAVIALIGYIFYLRRWRAQRRIVPTEEQSLDQRKVYFQHLRDQWATR